MNKFEKLSRSEMKNVLGGYPPPTCTATDSNPKKVCAPSGCQYQCDVYCDDSCGNPGQACASYWEC